MTSLPPPPDPSMDTFERSKRRPISGWLRSGKPLGPKFWLSLIGIGITIGLTVVAAANGWFTSKIEMSEHTTEFKVHQARPAHEIQLKWNEQHDEEMREQRRALRTLNDNVIRLQAPSRRRSMERLDFLEEEPE